MIFDFPVFLVWILPAMILFFLAVIITCGIIVAVEKTRGLELFPVRFNVTMVHVKQIVILNLLFQVVIIPCADLGANCWANCFGFVLIGQIGYLSNIAAPLVILMIGFLAIIRNSYLKSLIFFYGIFVFLQLGYLDKGLWCVVRSSGYNYLWLSFELLIGFQWIVYFTTLIGLFLKSSGEKGAIQS